MSRLELEFPVAEGSMAELRPRLDALIARTFDSGFLQSHWEGDVLVLRGPGAKGTVTYEDGRLVGRANLLPPASLLRPVIEQKLRSAMAQLAVDG